MELAINLSDVTLKEGSIILNDKSIMKLKRDYKISCIKEFIEENNDWNEEKVDFVSNRVYELMSEVENGEEERNAIYKAEQEFNKLIDWEGLFRDNRQEYKRKFSEFMGNERNICNCSNCPSVKNYDDSNTGFPCGQFICWVQANVKKDM